MLHCVSFGGRSLRLGNIDIGCIIGFCSNERSGCGVRLNCIIIYGHIFLLCWICQDKNSSYIMKRVYSWDLLWLWYILAITRRAPAKLHIITFPTTNSGDWSEVRGQLWHYTPTNSDCYGKKSCLENACVCFLFLICSWMCYLSKLMHSEMFCSESRRCEKTMCSCRRMLGPKQNSSCDSW